MGARKRVKKRQGSWPFRANILIEKTEYKTSKPVKNLVQNILTSAKSTKQDACIEMEGNSFQESPL